ncbi:ATP-binding cassette domain-containing protein [Mycetohabitans sp. B46]|uniref:ABC transporter ATP-binding protein C-terminal domain-containing protein n=1 Tax=Mycetohabitans sp. B46 TaxID=2772536 RepID=UPI00307FA090
MGGHSMFFRLLTGLGIRARGRAGKRGRIIARRWAGVAARSGGLDPHRRVFSCSEWASAQCVVARLPTMSAVCGTVSGLSAVANRAAGTLSYGHQRRLEIARCMITGPRLLMLDESAAGLNPQEKIELQQLIDGLRREFGVAVLLIEHDMGLVMNVSDRILVMEHGRPIVTGRPDEVCNDERVIKAYLGEA